MSGWFGWGTYLEKNCPSSNLNWVYFSSENTLDMCVYLGGNYLMGSDILEPLLYTKHVFCFIFILSSFISRAVCNQENLCTHCVQSTEFMHTLCVQSRKFIHTLCVQSRKFMHTVCALHTVQLSEAFKQSFADCLCR